MSIFTRVAGWVERKSGCVDRGARECAEDVVAFLAPFGSPVSGVSCFGNSAQRGMWGLPVALPTRQRKSWMDGVLSVVFVTLLFVV